MDLDIDVAGSSIDRDKGIALAALQGRQMLEIDVDEANTGGLEDANFWLVMFGACADTGGVAGNGGWRCGTGLH